MQWINRSPHEWFKKLKSKKNILNSEHFLHFSCYSNSTNNNQKKKKTKDKRKDFFWYGGYELLLCNTKELRITELKYLVECAIHHTKYSHYHSAVKQLLEARSLYNTCTTLLLKSKAGTKLAEGNDSLTLKDLEFEKKKIHCYLGKCYLCIGELQMCLTEINEVTSEGYLFGLEIMLGKCLLKTGKFKRDYVEKKRTEIALNSFVYTVLSDLYLMMFLFREAAFTAQIAIHNARAIKQLQFMANAYAAKIDASLMIGKLSNSKKTEKEALKNCLEAYTEINNWDLLSLGKVFLAIFKGRFYRGELVEAVEIGEAIIKIADSFKAVDVLTYVYPLMILVLANLHRLERIKQLLLKLQDPTDEVSYENGLRNHIYSKMNLFILIELGYSMIPPNMLINKIKREVNPKMIPVDRIISRRIAIYMWVYYLRRAENKKAKLWRIEPFDNVDFCYENITSTLTMLQGTLMYTAQEMESGAKIELQTLELVKRRVKKLEWICKNRMPIFLPRCFHLKAYYIIIWSSFSNTINVGGTIPGLKEISIALNYASEYENHHEMAWIEHSVKVWYSADMKPLDGEIYRKNHYNYDHMEYDNIIKYEHNDILYDLPLPRKVKRRLQNIIRLADYKYGGWSGKLRRVISFFGKYERLRGFVKK